MPSLCPPPLTLPDYWSPEQAAAAFEMIDLVRDHLWSLYGDDIQSYLRDDALGDDDDPRQIPLSFESDIPF